MAKILRPRRGTASVAKSQLTGNNKLASGEVFFELPDGKSWGGSEGKIIMGNGTNDYSALTPFIDPTKYVHTGQTENQSVAFTETSSTDNAALLKTIVSGVSIKNAFAGIKNLLSNLNSSVTQLNNELSTKISEDEINIERKRIDNIQDTTITITKFLKIQSKGIRNNNSTGLTFTFSSDSDSTLSALKDKSPKVIEANIVGQTTDGMLTNSASIPSSYVESNTINEYKISVFSDSKSGVSGSYVFFAIIILTYDEDVNIFKA